MAEKVAGMKISDLGSRKRQIVRDALEVAHVWQSRFERYRSDEERDLFERTFRGVIAEMAENKIRYLARRKIEGDRRK